MREKSTRLASLSSKTKTKKKLIKNGTTKRKTWQ